MIHRRDLLKISVTAGAVSTLLPQASTPAAEESQEVRIVDSNVSLFHWPFRRLPLDETGRLVKKLSSLGITQAWASSFEGLLHRDIFGVNARLAAACKQHASLIPIGCLNPELPGWKEDLRQCSEQHAMPGIRLFPNYHGYSLEDARFVRLLERATKAGMFVQIAASMEDTRTQHPQLQMPDTDLTPLLKSMAAIPNARVQILNHKLRPPLLNKLASVPGVQFDTARVDGTDGIPKFIQSVPAGRVIYGSHSPLLVPEAALIRVGESGLLDESALRALLSDNASKLLNRHHT